jgi:hypothetical protein
MALLTGHGVVCVLKQLVKKTALIVVRDLGFLAGVLTKPDRAGAVDGERFVTDTLKKAVGILGESQ